MERADSLLTGMVLTYNEEKNLASCLQSLQPLCQQIIVVDSGSTDRTQEIARKAGVLIWEHPFERHATQWRWALDKLPSPSEWVLGLDADQQISPELSQAIQTAFSQGDPPTDGFYFNRRQIFQGRWIRHGGYYPKYLLKLFRRSKVVIDPNDWMEHHFYIQGPTQILRGDLIEDNQNEWDLSDWCRKHLRYAQWAALEEFERHRKKTSRPLVSQPWGNPDQRTAWKKSIWSRLPLYHRSVGYFLWRYFFLWGFLDGPEGRRFHLLQGLWYRLLIDAHLEVLLQKQTFRP